MLMLYKTISFPLKIYKALFQQHKVQAAKSLCNAKLVKQANCLMFMFSKTQNVTTKTGETTMGHQHAGTMGALVLDTIACVTGWRALKDDNPASSSFHPNPQSQSSHWPSSSPRPTDPLCSHLA